MNGAGFVDKNSMDGSTESKISYLAVLALSQTVVSIVMVTWTTLKWCFVNLFRHFKKARSAQKCHIG